MFWVLNPHQWSLSEQIIVENRSQNINGKRQDGQQTFWITSTQARIKRTWKDLTESYGKSLYTNRNLKKAKWQHKNATKKFDYPAILDGRRTESWRFCSHQTGMFIQPCLGPNLPTNHNICNPKDTHLKLWAFLKMGTVVSLSSLTFSASLQLLNGIQRNLTGNNIVAPGSIHNLKLRRRSSQVLLF